MICRGEIVSPGRTVSTEVVTTVVRRLTITSSAKMIEGSATIRMVTISDGRSRIFQLLITIALIGEFFEAPRLEEGSALQSRAMVRPRNFVFERRRCSK